MSLDEDEIDAIAQAGAVVLRWAVVLLGVGFLARVACGCGGSEPPTAAPTTPPEVE